MMVDGRAGRSTGCKEGVVAVLVLVLLWQQASEAGERVGGVSAVEAGQSCSRHQGRHFLWGEREIGRRKSRKISLMIHITRKLLRVWFLFHLLFYGGGSDLRTYLNLCRYKAMQWWEWRISKNVWNAGVSAKTNKTLTRPVLYTHMVRAQAHHAMHHTHWNAHTEMHKAAIQNFPCSLVDAGKSDQIVYHLQSSTASRPLQMCLEVKERKRVKAEGKSRQGMWEKRLVISLLAKRCESGDQWEQAELQQHSGLSARWEQGEEQRGGRPALCYRKKETGWADRFANFD